jgi:hypothetical protein
MMREIGILVVAAVLGAGAAVGAAACGEDREGDVQFEDGTGTAGTGTAGTDTAGTGTAGTDTAGTGTAGTDTAGTGTAGTETSEDETETSP